MFNKNVIDVLTQVNGIAESVILKYPVTVAATEAHDVLVQFDISAIDGDAFEDLGIINLGEFLNTFRLFPDNTECSLIENTINISDGDTSLSYIVDNIALMEAYDLNTDNFERTESVPSVAQFDLSKNDIKKIKDASGVFKDLTDVIFTSQDGDITMSLGATGKYNAKSNKFSIVKQAQTNKEFEVKIPVENFKKLPMTEYTVDVKYNSERDSYRLLMTTTNVAKFKIIMCVVA